ncbi:MAG: thermonuclease family protein [Bacteroidota bacterium]|nr:thermonuclease family protein [Bacteroidota bacterium]
MHNVLVIIGLFLSYTAYCHTTGKVIRVIDGDTYELLVNSKKEVIRLANVDAPEKDQTFGLVSKDSVSALVLNQIVILNYTGELTYNRKVATLKVKGLELDSILVVKGWAWHFVAFSQKPQLQTLQYQAQNNRKGLWHCPNPVPPWIWRKFSQFNKRLWNVCR